jgi:AAA domain
MPTIVMTKLASKLDASVRKKAFAFLEKLSDNDASPGLHIEPITNSADTRVRTGRVDQFYRAILFKIPTTQDTTYVFHGIWPHDDAIAIAKKTVLSLNPVNGVAEIRVVEPEPSPVPTPLPAPAPLPQPSPGPAPVTPARQPLLPALGITRGNLVDELGVDACVADQALAATADAALLAIVDAAVEWQGLVLLELAAGTGVAEVRAKFALEPAPQDITSTAATEDELLLRGLQRPAAQISFTYIDGSEELRRVIEGGDFGAWRVFLHPEQRTYAEKTYTGPFRLSGGAGTGKTVVLLHRARNLSRRIPDARILVTTFTTNLADAMETDLRRLDPQLRHANKLGQPGLSVTGIDALASAVLRTAQEDLDLDVQAVLGVARAQVSGRFAGNPWRDALDAAGAALTENLRNDAFLAAEYNTVILPNRITTKEEYLRVRRPGRGVALDRTKRASVWDVVAACRAQARVSGTIDFQEATAIAAAHLERVADHGHLFDHVLVDEGQDLSPVHWQLLRALVAEHVDDLFIAEDSHQRIYGRRVVLGQYGIRIVGRSRRLTLNYRTTAQTLAYALRILQGAHYVDIHHRGEAGDVAGEACQVGAAVQDRFQGGAVVAVEPVGTGHQPPAGLTHGRRDRSRGRGGLSLAEAAQVAADGLYGSGVAQRLDLGGEGGGVGDALAQAPVQVPLVSVDLAGPLGGGCSRLTLAASWPLTSDLPCLSPDSGGQEGFASVRPIRLRGSVSRRPVFARGGC